ncbi:serine/threonine protein kinase [Mycobacterium sp.]|uniref:serine/threonine-protein kinase n=1 Tax=Mycobacterium sp. TaxID=1785 RepID=UPI001221138C|nr:serine/threonine protein kinase [Mycobacterium sp.]TAM69152.1 MAG: serine/threonine protein kinase [Mycobacterium sp.]
MPLTNGQIFAGYIIIRLLGSGGMGEVYLAQHPRLPRRDALKLLPREWSADEEFRARFDREADLASTLWHPHIVGVHDRGEEDGQLWLSMDFIDGFDAARLLAERYPSGMPVKDVVRIITAVASALDYAHKQELLHRDIKPANIMLTHLDDDGEQRILLTDFGIARNINDISGLTKTNFTVGTVAYAAPEQLLGEDLDGRADQYSLAATAFHLLTGSQLFPNSNPAVVISRHLNVPPPALADSRPGLSALDPVLGIALAKDPDARFAGCSDFARALAERAVVGTTTSAAPTKPAAASGKSLSSPASGSGRSSQADHPGKRWLNVAVPLAVIALVAAGAIIWHPWQRGPEQPPSTPTSNRQPLGPLVASPTTSAAATPPPGSPTSTGRTELITEVAVGADGQPTNGYTEVPANNSMPLGGCDTPSPSAVSGNIYSCYPSAAAANVCWPSAPSSMLCMANPWDKEVRRLSYDTSLLTTVQPPKNPKPFALMLDNGTHCNYISGGARRGRNDGYVPDYACGADLMSSVLGNGSGSDPINRTTPLWTVTFEQPGFQTQVRSVTTAWFAGD